MKSFFSGIFHTVAAIYVAGLLLDEAGKGTFGAEVANVAAKITKGYGQ
jgi:hypothetical protein